MPEKLLKNQIIDWLKNYDYWFKYSGNRLLEGDELTEELIETAYALFKEDNKLKETESDRVEIIFNAISVEEKDSIKSLKLQFIKDITNVNALAPGQSIEINPNLTIVYGANGTGKSGYIRLLNNAFNSRGDKRILPDVFNNEANGEPYCKFTFLSDGVPYDLEYPKDKENEAFIKFSVFDSQSVKVHLEQDNKLNFTPSGFDFFEKTLQLYEALTSRLKNEIAKNRPENEFIRHFANETPIKSEILNLSSKTDINKLEQIGDYTEADEEKLNELIAKHQELRALNIPRKISELQKIQGQLAEFNSRLQAILDHLKLEDIRYYQSLIDSFHQVRELVKQEGIDGLKEYKIDAVGSSEWREFLKASKSYVDKILENRNRSILGRINTQVEYPSGNDCCIFCLQPLTDKENTIINLYWKLVKSEAEAELSRIIQKCNKVEKLLKGFAPAKFDESTVLFEYVKSIDPALAESLKNLTEISKTSIQNLLTNISTKNWELAIPYNGDGILNLDLIQKHTEDAIDLLFKKNPTKELEELDVNINYLKDKNLINKLLDKVLSFVLTHQWAAKAEKCLSIFNTRSVTTKQGELFTEHITDNYIELFNSECEILNAPRVVHIIQKNAKVSTLRKLQIAGYDANNILSEGEQRAISLADFLTEVKLNPVNKGIFFDDPVTSQDHERREKIAEHLVDIAQNKQIVVFTHDISFFIRLKLIAELKAVNHQYTTLRKSGGIIGITNPELPWIVQPVSKRISYLKDKLVLLTKIEKDKPEDEYLFFAKSWYGLLRETWERSVEERLFKGVVERFSPGIQTQKLKKLTVSDELIKDIEIGMTESSNWLHDAAAGLNPTPPNSAKAKADLELLENFAKKCISA